MSMRLTDQLGQSVVWVTDTFLTQLAVCMVDGARFA
jgi:hypothetical protein